MNPKKRVLIVTYYWPPAGGISLHRCLKFTKYLRQFGWEPIVYTAKDAQYPYYDEGNFKDIPEGMVILKQPIIEPFGLFKKLSGRRKDESLNNIVHVREKKQRWIDRIAIWIRGNFFIPDARSLWIRPSVKYLIKYLKDHPVDAVLSDGPPHTNTVIAMRICQKLNIPFLADFQDPWTQVDYYSHMKLTRWADRRHRQMEQQVFRQADKITIASRVWKQDLEAIGARNVEAVYWGYDEEDFANLSHTQPEYFTITHAGLMGYDRLPDKFLKVIAELCAQDAKFAKKLRLHFPGQLDYAVQQAVSQYNLNTYLAGSGTLPRQEVLQLLCSSSVLLLLLNQADNAKGRVPGKFFEYLRARRPILCLGPVEGDVHDIIMETDSGLSCKYNDEETIKAYILSQYEAFLKKTNTTTTGDIRQYSVDQQTMKVADYLNQITAEDA